MNQVLAITLITAAALTSGCSVQNRNAKKSSSQQNALGSLFNQPLQIIPSEVSVSRGGTIQLTAAGGATGSYSWSMAGGPGSVSGGLFAAPNSNGTSRVQVMDAAGNLAYATVYIANPGDPDLLWKRSRYDAGGNVADTGQVSVRVPEDKIVVAGSSDLGRGYALMRLNADGSVDTSFGNPAVFIKPHENTTSYTPTFLLYQPPAAGQAGYKLIVGGGCLVNQVNGICVARIDDKGQLDPTFGNQTPKTGRAFITPVAPQDTLVNRLQFYTATAAALDSQGRILLGGTAIRNFTNEGSVRVPLILRLRADGTLDIGTNGQRGTGFGDVALDPNSANGAPATPVRTTGRILPVSQDTDGNNVTGLIAGLRTYPVTINGNIFDKVVAVAQIGFARNESLPNAATVFRYTTTFSAAGAVSADGILDTDLVNGFGSVSGNARLGFVRVGLAGNFVLAPKGILLGKDGRLIVGATAYRAGSQNQDASIGIIWLRPDGVLDPEFGKATDGEVNKQGRARFVIAQNSKDFLNAFDRQADGKLVISAITDAGSTAGSRQAVYRLRADGSNFDTTFGTLGTTYPAFDAADTADINQVIALPGKDDVTSGPILLTGGTGQDFYVLRLRN